MRIRGLDEETEEALEDYEEIKGKIADLTKTKLTPGGVSLFTDASKTEYKSTYQFLKEISEIWSELTDKQQAGLLEAIAGKRGGQVLAGVLSDFSEVERAMGEMENAAGAADDEMSIIEDSLEYKLNALKQTWVGTLQDITDRGQIGGVIDFLTSVSEGLGGIIDKFGLLQTALVTVGAIYGSQKGILSYDKTKGQQEGFWKGFEVGDLPIINANKELLKKGKNADFLNDMQKMLGKKEFNEYVDNYVKNIGKVDEAVVQFAKDQNAAGNTTTNLTKTFVKQTSPVKGLTAALKGLGGQLMAGIGNALMSAGIAAAVSVIITAITKLASSYSDLVKRASESTAQYKSSQSTLSGYADEIKELRTTLGDYRSTTEECSDANQRLYEIQADLISTYGSQASGIDLVNGKLDEQIDKINELDKNKLNEWANEINGEQSALSEGLNFASNLLGIYSGWGLGKGTKAVSSAIAENRNVFDALKETYLEKGAFGINFGEEFLGKSLEQINDKVEKFSAKVKASNSDIINDYISQFEHVKFADGKFEFFGDVSQVADEISTIQLYLSDIGMENSDLYSQLTKIYNKANDIKKTSYETYQTGLLRDIKESDDMVEYYNDLEKAYNTYKDAIKNGDKEEISDAQKRFTDIIAAIENSDMESKYKEYFENMYPDLQNLVDSWNLKVKLEAEITNEDAIWSGLSSYTDEEVFDLWNRFQNDTTDLSKSQIEFMSSLNDAAAKTGHTVQELIALLRELEGEDPTAIAHTKLYEASYGKGEIPLDLLEAYENYKIAVEEFEAGGLEDTDKSNTKWGNVDLGRRQEIVWDDKAISENEEALRRLAAAELGLSDATELSEVGWNNFVEKLKYTTSTIMGSYTQFDKYVGENGESLGIEFTPILQTENGAKLLTQDEIDAYINDIIAGIEQNGEEVTIDTILKYDQKGQTWTDKNGLPQSGKGLIMGGGFKSTEALEQDTENAHLISQRVEAFKDLHNAIQGTNYSIEDLEKQFNKGLKWTEEDISNFIDSLDEDQIIALAQISVDEISKAKTKEEILNMISDIQEQAEIDIQFNANRDTADKFAELQQVMSPFDTAYQISMGNDSDQSDMLLKADQINAVVSAMGSLADKEPEFETALRKWQDEMMRGATGAEAQTAYDDLITAYLAYDGTLNNLTDDNKKWAQSMLEELGITDRILDSNGDLITSDNALMLANNALSKSTVRFNNSMKKLDDTLGKHYKTLRESDKGSKDYEDSLNEIKKATQDLFSFENESGDVVTPELSDEFIIKNLENIREAAGGSIEALDELRTAASQEIVANVEIDVPSGMEEGVRTQLTNLLAQLQSEAKDIEVGAYLDESPALRGLQHLCENTGIAAQDMQAMLAGIGIAPEISYQEATVEVDTSSIVEIAKKEGVEAAHAHARAKQSIKIPTIRYKPTGSAAGGGFRGSSSPGSGGGGGGNGGGSGDTAEQSYDWIETAIQRIEREISNLNKIVDSTYENWTKRNTKLKDEIAKVTEEIQKQKDAAEIYSKKANEEVVGRYLKSDTNKDGLDQATITKYMLKVQRGEINKTNINESLETIKENQKLIDFISEYMEW